MADGNPRANDLFLSAVEIVPPDERRAFLDERCGDDADLRRQVESLLAARETAGDFMNQPAVGASAPVRTTHYQPAIEPDTVIAGRYTLVEKIGEGGMGEVWVAKQSEPVKRKVALKLIKAGMDSKLVLGRFEQERHALALMEHPNIAKILDAGVTGEAHGLRTVGLGRPFFVMELVNGLPLTRFCDEAKLSPRQRLELFVPICQAVQHAHNKGIVHRDLKPTNILVTLLDGMPVPKVIDFGLAKATGGKLTDESLSTQFGAVVGTLEYMSPEQTGFSDIDIDTRADIYSLGVILYELLTGLRPFDRKRLQAAALDEMIRMIRKEEPSKPSTRLSSDEALPSLAAVRQMEPRRLMALLRGELDWVVMKCLEKDRNRRYETANGLARDVQRFLADEPVEARPPSARYRAGKFLRRNRGPVLAALLLLLALIGGIVGTTMGLIRAERARDAEFEQRTAAEAQRDRATAAEAKAKEETAIAAAVKSFLQYDLLAEAAPEKNPRDKKVTVEEILDRAAERITDKFGDKPLVEATIRETIGVTYWALGKYPAAQPHLERALEIFRRVLGKDDRITLNCLGNLAILINDLGQSGKAEQLFEEQFEARRRVLGEEHPDTIVSMNNLAEMFRRRGDVVKAEPLFVKALEVNRRVRGEDHIDTQTAINNLALVFKAQGQYADAEPLFLETLDNRRRIMGEEHPDTLTVINNLAAMYYAQGRYAEAEPHYIKALELRRRALGADHPTTLVSVLNLASLYRSQGRYADAEPLNIHALEASRRDLGEEHLLTLQSTRKLAMLRRAQGHDLAAEPLFVKALEVSRRVLGENHSETLFAMTDLADLYDKMDQFLKAEPLYREALEKSRKALGAKSLQAVAAQSSLGENLLKQQKHADAETVLREAFALRAQLAPDAWTTFHTQSLLGGALFGQKKLVEAEPLLLQGHEGMKLRAAKIPKLTKDPSKAALQRLMQLYEAWEKPDEAEKWRMELQK